MYFAEYKNVFFIEGFPPEADVISEIASELNGAFSQNHLRSLDDLKEKMRAAVLKRGGNCVVDFKYGQRSTFWKSLLGMDNVYWYGTGKIATIPPSEMAKYRSS